MEFTTDKKGEPLSRRLPFKTDRADVYSWGYLDFYYCNDFLDYHGLRRQSLSASGGIRSGRRKQRDREAGEQVAGEKRSLRKCEFTSAEQFGPLLRSGFGWQSEGAVAPCVCLMPTRRVQSYRGHQRAMFTRAQEGAEAIGLRPCGVERFIGAIHEEVGFASA